MSIIFESFKTLEELGHAISTRPDNEPFKYAEKNSLWTDDERRNKTFYGSNSFEEAIDILKTGYKEPLEKMKKEISRFNRQAVTFKPKMTQSVVGFAPHVPNAIQGIPLSMINRVDKKEKAKTIHLLYGFSATADIKAQQLIKGGIMFISLVNSLEMAGFRVKIDIIRCTTASSTDAIGYKCTLKEYSQPLNLLKLCFPLVHPSMLRRVSFRWCETLPELKNTRYVGGYGASLIVRMGLDHQKEKQFLIDHGILGAKNQYYCNVYQAMDAKSVDELAEQMGLR